MPAPTDSPQPINVNALEASRLVGMSEKTVRSLARDKRIPHVRIDGRLLFPVQALSEWFNERARQSVDLAPASVIDEAPRRRPRPRRVHP